MGTKYSSVSVSGYNSSPPADDGSTAASNQVTWAKIKTKLSDALNTAIAAINSGLTTAFDYSARSVSTSDTALAGDHMKTIEIASTVSSVVTITLSDAATMAAGYCVGICNRSNYTAIVTRATASDVIDNTAGAVNLLPLYSVGYKVNASTNGYLTTHRGTVTSVTSNLTVRSAVSASGSAVDFTSIPSGIKRIILSFVGVSENGTAIPLIQLGTGSPGTLETSGYAGAVGDRTAVSASSSSGFSTVQTGNAAYVTSGSVILTLEDSATNTWSISGTLGISSGAAVTSIAGTKSLAAALTMVSITTTDTFDAGSFGIMYE